MKYQLDYEVTDKKYNLKLTIFGIIFLCFRLLFMTPFINEDGTFHPEIFHTSYIISILICLSMVFSFRVKALNVVAFAVLPSVIFSIFMHDIPFWFAAESVQGDFGAFQVGDLLWWNFLTIHTPIPIIAFYMYFTRKDTLSISAVYMILPIGLTWLLTLDDLQNGTLNGSAYLMVAFPILVVWALTYQFLVMKNIKTKDPLIAPVLKLNSFKLIKVKQN